MNLKEVGHKFLPEPITSVSVLDGLVLLQISNVRNLSAPAGKQMADNGPRMLSISLTDGFSKIQAIEMDPLPIR